MVANPMVAPAGTEISVGASGSGICTSSQQPMAFGGFNGISIGPSHHARMRYH